MKKTFGTIVVLGFAVVLFGVSCCTKPPEELASAKEGYQAAESACAADYVKAELDEAKAMLDKAQAFADDKKCKDSKASSLQAIELAKKAEQDAVAEKAKAKTLADEAIAAAVKAGDTAKAEDAETYAKAELDAGDAALGEAKNLMANDECKYYQVKKMADDAAAKFGDAAAKAIAEKARIAEEKRKAEEAARMAAEEELKRHPKEWTVVKGECLWKIAGYDKIYADPFQWPLIYKANKAQIKDPDLIHPGQVFAIPRNVSDEEVQQAIKEAKNRPWPVENFFFDGK